LYEGTKETILAEVMNNSHALTKITSVKTCIIANIDGVHPEVHLHLARLIKNNTTYTHLSSPPNSSPQEFEILDYVAKNVRGCNQPFGGIRLIASANFLRVHFGFRRADALMALTS
jgi:hypothetical protein